MPAQRDATAEIDFLKGRRWALDMLSETVFDPVAFVEQAFRWGDEGTALEHEAGPDLWQMEELRALAKSLDNDPHKIWRVAIASGHGIGKSAFLSWIIVWAIMTWPNTRGVVTANTDNQLRTKTWAEVTKWFNLLVQPLREMFAVEATSIHCADKELARTWRIDATPWSIHNTEAFAGLHNAGSRVLIVFDEASAIPDRIWEVAEGATTDADTQIMWFAYGNPTQNTGRFKEAVEGRQRDQWRHRHIDSRTVARTNKARLDQWVESYGEDSDFVRVRVRGMFPRASSMQFIASDAVRAAMDRQPAYTANEPLIYGIDVARFGDDRSVLAKRRGTDAQSMDWNVWRKMDTMTIAGMVHEQAQMENPDAIFVDTSGGLGAGVADRLRAVLPKTQVLDVEFGGAGGVVVLRNGTSMKAFNMSARMWMLMRDWMATGCIPDDSDLEADLTGRLYGFAGAESAIQLEKKDDMKKRGLASPDLADALALTFAYPVALRMPKPMLHLPNLPTDTEQAYDVFRDIR
jgi:hypothetical protein